MITQVAAQACSPVLRDPAKASPGLQPQPPAALGMCGDTYKPSSRRAAALALVQFPLAGDAGAVNHLDGTLAATDGQRIDYRITSPAGQPKALVIYMEGTLGKASDFDGMAGKLAASGIKSYAVTSRVAPPDHFSQHAQDLDDVIRLARRENPGVPITVMGCSLGASIALDWGVRHRAENVPVAALAPVFWPKFLNAKEIVEVSAGDLSHRAAEARINSPMSAGVQTTTNPDAPAAHLVDPKSMTLPAGLYSQVLDMSLNLGAHARQIKGPVFIGMGGLDHVGTNPITREVGKLIGSHDKTVQTFPTAAHDLGQEFNHPELVNALSTWVLNHAQQVQ